MSALKRTILVLAAFIMRSSQFLGFTLLAAVLVIGSPDKIFATLKSADAYSRFSQGLVDQNQKVSAGQSDVPLQDPKVAEIIRSSFAADDLQNKTEGLFNDVYRWLSGENRNLQFTIDISANKEKLASGLSKYAIDRIKALPECRTIPTETNIFKVDCRPAYLDLDAQSKQIYDSIMSSEEFLPKTTFTQNDLPKTDTGQSFSEGYSKIPQYYRIFMVAPYALLGLSLLCSLLVIFLSRTRRGGLKIVASSLISTAVFLSLTPIIYTYVLPRVGMKLPSMNGGDQAAFMSEIVNDVTSSLYTEFNVMLINIAIQVGAVGFVVYFLARFFKTKGNVYEELEKRSGMMSSIARKTSAAKTTTNERRKIPLQTSEGKVKTVKSKTVDKKFRKM